MEIRILITGGAGNIGSSLAKELIKNSNYFVVIVDNLLTGNKDKLPKPSNNWVFIQADVNNYNEISSIMLCYKFNYVFHYAAVVGVERTLNNPKWVLNDIDGIKNILDLSKNTGVLRVFYASSSEVYGEPVEIPQHEHTTPLNSRLPYAIVKNVGEAFLKSYKKEYDLDYTIFRFFNTYGPQQSTDFVISKFIWNAINNEDIKIYGDGNQTRTFCYIKDNVETVSKILEQDIYINSVINIGSDLEIPIINLAEKIKIILNSNSNIIHVAALKEGDMTRRCPDNSIMKSILSRDLTSLEEGITLTSNYLLATLV